VENTIASRVDGLLLLLGELNAADSALDGALITLCRSELDELTFEVGTLISIAAEKTDQATWLLEEALCRRRNEAAS
jgi:hypothetical protein